MTREDQLQYWRDKTARNHSQDAISRRTAERAEEKRHALDSAVHRDPCTYCGTRADYGCRHNPLRVRQIGNEARTFGANAILTDPEVVNRAWDREIELARIEGQRT